MAAETTEDRSVFAGWARDGVSPLVEAKSAGTGAREEQSGAPRTIRADVAIAELEAKFRAMHPQMEPLYPRDRGESLGQWWKSGFGEAFRRRPNDIQGTPDRLLWLKTAGNVVSTAAKDIVKIVIPGRGK